MRSVGNPVLCGESFDPADRSVSLRPKQRQARHAAFDQASPPRCQHCDDDVTHLGDIGHRLQKGRAGHTDRCDLAQGAVGQHRIAAGEQAHLAGELSRP